jgi:hypothetical protein
LLETWLSKSTLVESRLAEASLLKARLTEATLWSTKAATEWTVSLRHSHGNSHQSQSDSNLPTKLKKVI